MHPTNTYTYTGTIRVRCNETNLDAVLFDAFLKAELLNDVTVKVECSCGHGSIDITVTASAAYSELLDTARAELRRLTLASA